MFMAKGELKNAGQLTRIRLMGARRNLINISIIIGALFLANLIPMLVWLFRATNQLDSYGWSDNSFMFMFGVIVGILILNCIYRQSNQNIEAFPQTNTSRFLSSQALFYTIITLVSAVLLATYLIQYGAVAVIAIFCKNIRLIYSFDVSFVISGFFTLIVYTSIIIAVISLIAALIRKFRLYAIVFFILTAGLIITHIQTSFEIFKKLFGFLIFEHSVLLFLLKGILFWTALFAAAFIINKYTVYYRDAFKLGKAVVAGIAVAVVLAVISVGIAAMITSGDSTFSISFGGGTAVESNDYEPPTRTRGTIELDISGLPNGSEITVVTSGDIGYIKDASKVISNGSYGNGAVYYEFEDGSKVEYPSGYLIFENNGNLRSFTGKKLTVEYYYPVYMRESKDVFGLVNPSFNARLEGTMLYLDYTYDKNVKAVFLPVWSFMWQFDYFKGKDIFNEHVASTYCNSEGRIYINVE